MPHLGQTRLVDVVRDSVVLAAVVMSPVGVVLSGGPVGVVLSGVVIVSVVPADVPVVPAVVAA